MPATLLALAALQPLGIEIDSGSVAAEAGCQTPFLVFTDPSNPGSTSQSGEVVVTRGNFEAGMATGNFVVLSGTGNDTAYQTAGTIEGTIAEPVTLEGADVGLC